MSQHQAYGTITTDTTTDEVVATGTVTMSAHLNSGSGTWTWQYKGLDGTWRSIYFDLTTPTELSYTSSHQANIFFGNPTRVRGNASSGSSPDWDWEIRGNYRADV